MYSTISEGTEEQIIEPIFPGKTENIGITSEIYGIDDEGSGELLGEDGLFETKENQIFINTNEKEDNLPFYFNGSCLATGRYAHPALCHQYFVCKNHHLVTGKLTLQGLELTHECQYPLLYDVKLRECRPYKQVQCGIRYETKSPCKYRREVCT